MNYYDENPHDFFEGTVDADMTQHYEEDVTHLNLKI